MAADRGVPERQAGYAKAEVTQPPNWHGLVAWDLLFNNGATGLFLKGQDIEAELAEAAKVWTFQSELQPSASSDTGHIWIVKGAPRER